MSSRPLSAQQLAQRQLAALRSGAFSATATRPASDRLYEHLRRRVVRSSGPTTPQLRLRLRLLATTLAKIELAELWLAQQDHELFRDALTGEVHPLIERVDRWVAAASPMIDRLPAGAARAIEDDLPTLLAARGRRG